MSEDKDLEEIEIDQVGVMGPIHVFLGCMLVSLEMASCSQSLIEQGYCNLLLESNWPVVIVCCLFYFWKECLGYFLVFLDDLVC